MALTYSIRILVSRSRLLVSSRGYQVSFTMAWWVSDILVSANAYTGMKTTGGPAVMVRLKCLDSRNRILTFDLRSGVGLDRRYVVIYKLGAYNWALKIILNRIVGKSFKYLASGYIWIHSSSLFHIFGGTFYGRWFTTIVPHFINAYFSRRNLQRPSDERRSVLLVGHVGKTKERTIRVVDNGSGFLLFQIFIYLSEIPKLEQVGSIY